MKTQIIVGIIVGIIIIIATGLFAKYKIFDDKIELKYVLSEKITSDFNDKSEIAIQQLTIKNSGEVPINSIIIKIHADVSDFQIKKFRHNDSISTSKTLHYLEITYPELPPNGELFIILKSTNSGINDNEIEIFHNKGMAKEAFANNDSNSISYLLYIFIFIYLCLILFGLRSTLIDSFSYKIYYSPYEDILKHKKPWYFSLEKWTKLRKDAINKIFENGYSVTIEKSSFYNILDSEKANTLSIDEWKSIIEKAEEKLLIVVAEKLFRSYYFSYEEEIFNLKRPKYVHLDVWEKIQIQISIVTCLHKLIDVLRYSSESSLLGLLNLEKPELVTIADWDKLIDIASTLYASSVIKNGAIGSKSYDLESYKNSVVLDVLDNSNSSKIIKVFDKIIEAEELEVYYNQLLQNQRLVFTWVENVEKPDVINNEDWNKIIDIYNKVVLFKKESEENLIEALEIKEKTTPLLDKVTKQLDIIDRILEDPEAITKIEEYNIPFEIGNWENLKKVADYLRIK